MSVFIKRTWKVLKKFQSQFVFGLICDIFLAMSGIFVVLEFYISFTFKNMTYE